MFMNIAMLAPKGVSNLHEQRFPSWAALVNAVRGSHPNFFTAWRD